MMKTLFKNEDGAAAIEYALICALIVVACVASFSLLGSSSNGLWSKVNSNVSSKL
jgi:Flp pilus assembly pilin Flp